MAVVISVVSLLVGRQQGGVCPEDVKHRETLPPLRFALLALTLPVTHVCKSDPFPFSVCILPESVEGG